MAIESPEAPF